MPIVEALVLVVFGIALPTWDVGSDIALSHSLFSKKPCNITRQGGWEYYVREHLNGIEPPFDNATGKLISISFEFCFMIIKVLSTSEEYINILDFSDRFCEYYSYGSFSGFQCKPGRRNCISRGYICDGYKYCDDGSDENPDIRDCGK